jgi:hypothetical protein
MSVSRRTRLAVIAAAASGVLVVAMAGTALAADHLDRVDCSDIDLQDAQAALDAVARSERHRLDSLCTSITTRLSDDTEEADDAVPATTPAAVPDEDSTDAASADDDSADKDDADKDDADKNDAEDDSDKNDADKNDADKNDADKNDAEDGDKDDGRGDRDCADFDSQADAQAAFDENSADDPERLDADDDGIACEDHFDTEGQQVAVHPNGGVATGGAALP